MRNLVAYGYLKPADYGCQVGAMLARHETMMTRVRFDFCPWCGTKL